MTWFLNLTTRNKLLIGFGGMIVFVAIVIATGYSVIAGLKTSQQTLYQKDFANLNDISALRGAQDRVRAELLEAQLVKTSSEREHLLKDVSVHSVQIRKIMAVLLERAGSEPKLRARLEEFDAIEKAFAQTRETEIIPLIRAGKIDESQKLIAGIQQGRQEKMRAILGELSQSADDNARVAVEASARHAAQTGSVFVAVGALTILLGLTMVFIINRAIADPLRAVSELAGRVAGGDLSVNIPDERRADEVGALLRAFLAMVTSLRQTTRQINEGVGVLVSSSSEILATTAQVAAGSAQTATAVSETTATVEEVKQTAQLASQKARYVADSAQKAAQVSQAGRKSVQDAIAGMHRIQEQMESIAGSIVQLSEQSQAIGEIIATVNDLAEQSNVLAVNAAIEAAKAGEQGKGFAVVAQEVKSLAEQSKQATTQVRAILGDIQKATGAAVLATEQGHKAVQAGVRQSSEASDAISQLAESVDEAAQAATQIAASSQQQTVGMDQVVLAMDNIKQASAQNVAGARQAEVAAQGLHELGVTLQTLIGRPTA